MKPILLLLITVLFFNCSKEIIDPPMPESQNDTVLMLKVDFLNEVFEGGKEIMVNEPIADFDVTSNYQEPGDFGGIQLYSANSNTLLFDGTIVWMGLGEVQYPLEIESPANFSTLEDAIELPVADQFENVMYSEFAYYPEDMDLSTIWNAIDDLALVKTYRDANPEAKIQMFLYTPSVGDGDSAEWDWMIFMKN